MTDDRLTGYATENVAPLTPPDLELLGELARQLPRVEGIDALVWSALEADPAFVEGMRLGRADFDAGRTAPFRHAADRPIPYSEPERLGDVVAEDQVDVQP